MNPTAVNSENTCMVSKVPVRELQIFLHGMYANGGTQGKITGMGVCLAHSRAGASASEHASAWCNFIEIDRIQVMQISVLSNSA